MPGDRQQFRDALVRWDTLHHHQQFSVPAEIGKVAVICSSYTYEPVWPDEHATPEDPVIFKEEALELADRLDFIGKKAQLLLNATYSDVEDALKDVEVSDVVVIGHGDLTCVQLEEEEKRYEDDDPDSEIFCWLDVSVAATHLKTGQFIQRTCGGQTHDLSVPLGLFAVADQRNVIAAAGHFFNPASLTDPSNELLQPISEYPRLSYKQVKQLFPKRKKDPN